MLHHAAKAITRNENVTNFGSPCGYEPGYRHTRRAPLGGGKKKPCGRLGPDPAFRLKQLVRLDSPAERDLMPLSWGPNFGHVCGGKRWSAHNTYSSLVLELSELEPDPPSASASEPAALAEAAALGPAGRGSWVAQHRRHLTTPSAPSSPHSQSQP